MSATTSSPGMLWRFGLCLKSFLGQPGLPFADALPEARIAQAFADEGIEFRGDDEDEAVYTPAITLWAFLSQMLFSNEQRSCLAAVARVAVLWAVLGKQVCASNSGAYCRARARITEEVLARLSREVAEECERQVPADWLWCDKHVFLIDGTTISLPDTEANQTCYPQPATQKPGLGFPLVRLVVLISLATGLLREAAMGPYAGKETGETALLRESFARLQPGDVLLGDRYYCGWFMVALLQELGVDLVTRLHQLRAADFQRGKRLGPGDHVVEWPRPAQPDWMDDATYARMPASLRLREVEVQVAERGFRVQSLVVVTTLLDPLKYAASELALLYRQRWLVELDLRTIKSTLHLDVLRCKSPEMARKELRTGLLAYNLIRQTMLTAARTAGCSPRALSFTAALQTIAAAWLVAVTAEEHGPLLQSMCLEHLACHRIGNRPNRLEPRAIKRRPKPHALLTEPRTQARAKLLAAAAT